MPPFASLMDPTAAVPELPVETHQLHFDYDDVGDGSMSDITGDYDDEDEDEEDDLDQGAFFAVFPQAPTLVKQHALRPLTDALRLLIATPDHLMAALLPTGNQENHGVQDLGSLSHKAHTYTQTTLAAALSSDDWQRVAQFLQYRDKADQRDDHWTSPLLVEQVDALMVKLTLYYTNLWTYLTTIAIGHVHSVETTITQLLTEWIPPAIVKEEDSSMMALLSMPLAEPATPLFRPLRLRSHTAAAAMATALSSATPAASPVASTPPTLAAASSHRARLARQSNEFMIAWFLHHKTNPYPSASERVQIAHKTGLTEQQVRNWFANMRKRHWRPKHEKKTKQPRCLLDLLLRQNDATVV